MNNNFKEIKFKGIRDRIKWWYIKYFKKAKTVSITSIAHIAVRCILEEALINITKCEDCDTQCVEYNKLREGGII